MSRKPHDLCLIDQRQSERNPTHPEIFCLLYPTQTATPVQARVLDISGRGVSLILPEIILLGAEADVQFMNQARGASCRRHMLVLYMLHQTEGEYRIGGTFTQSLSRQELELLCGPT